MLVYILNDDLEVKMVGKKNFKSVAEVERAIYSTQKQLMEKKITAKDAATLSSLYKLWLESYRARKLDELSRRIDGLEEIARMLQKG